MLLVGLFLKGNPALKLNTIPVDRYRPMPPGTLEFHRVIGVGDGIYLLTRLFNVRRPRTKPRASLAGFSPIW